MTGKKEKHNKPSGHPVIRSSVHLVIWLSALSLAAALTAQYAFDLAPCILCLYQRIPFALAIIFGVIGLAYKPAARPMLGLSALAFAANAALAFYHTGVERKWWRSFLEGCAVPDLGDDPDKILEHIMNAPAARCDEIPWADPLLGLSMANYNVLWSAALCALCVIALLTEFQKR